MGLEKGVQSQSSGESKVENTVVPVNRVNEAELKKHGLQVEAIEWEFAKFFFEKMPKEQKLEKDYFIQDYFEKYDYAKYQQQFPHRTVEEYRQKRKKFKDKIKIDPDKKQKYEDILHEFCEQHKISDVEQVRKLLKHSVHKQQDDNDLVMTTNKSYYEPGKQKLGEGVFGTVKLAVSHDEGKIFVSKAIHVKTVGILDVLNNILSLEQEKELSQQALGWSKLSSRRVSKSSRKFDGAKISEKAYLSLEYIPGKDIPDPFDEHTKHKKLPPRELLRGSDKPLDQCGQILFAIRLLEVLDNLQKHRIVHNDLKTDNIKWQVQDNGDIKMWILDFGTACQLNEGENKRKVSSIPGNKMYVAPEKLNELTVGYCSDNWAMAKILADTFGYNDAIKVYEKNHPMQANKVYKTKEESIPSNDNSTISPLVYQELLNPDPESRLGLRNAIGVALYQLGEQLKQQPEHPLQAIFQDICKKYQFNPDTLGIHFYNNQVLALLNQRHAQLYHEASVAQTRSGVVSVFMGGTDSERKIKDEALVKLIKAAESKKDANQPIIIDELIKEVRNGLANQQQVANFDKGVEKKSAHLMRGESAFSSTLAKIQDLEQSFGMNAAKKSEKQVKQGPMGGG